MRRRTRSAGQALVEFALAATLLFTLLAAAVDLGFIFFTVQTLRAAAQEGATFGSYPVICPSQSQSALCTSYGTNIAVIFNEAEIRNRVRFSAGDQSRGFVNLLDLNNDGTADDATVLATNITIQNLFDANYDGDPSNDGGVSCSSTAEPVTNDFANGYMRNAGYACYIRVTVRYSYRLVFPLTPAFADRVTIPVSFTMPVRSSFIG